MITAPKVWQKIGYLRGQVANVDRAQRLVIGAALMVLTLTSVDKIGWRTYLTLAIQTDLLLTGLFGWCPVYWTCRNNRQENDEPNNQSCNLE